MIWHDLLNEVKHKKTNASVYGLNCNLKRERKMTQSASAQPARVLKQYKLGGKFANIYFTLREAQCMAWLLKGKTIVGVADALQLSPRTVEFYIKNMKAKVQCRTKFELIEIVHATEFLKNIDF